MAFTLSGGPNINRAFSTSSLLVQLPSVEAGDTIVVWIIANNPLRSITSITCSGGESDLTWATSYELFGTQRISVAYLINVQNSGDPKNITITLDGPVSILTAHSMAIKPPVGFESTVTYDGENDNGGSGTSGTVSITTVRNQSAVIAQLVCGTGADPIIPAFGGGYTRFDAGGFSGTTPVLYNLNTATAGVKNVDWTQDNAFWHAGAAAFSHDADSLIEHVGSGGFEAGGSADVVDQTGDVDVVVGSGGAEAGGSATIVFILPTDETLVGDGGLEASGTVAITFLLAYGSASFEALTAEGEGESARNGIGRGYFAAMTAEGSALVPEVGDASVTLEAMSAVGYGPNSGAAAFEPMTAAGLAVHAGIGVASFQPLTVIANVGFASFQPLAIVVALGEQVDSDTFDIKVVNLRTGAVTEFTNHNYNSFARIGTDYYAAGATGLVKLSGATDPGNADINWQFKTGQMDDKNPDLKRLPEVLLGLRSDQRIVVTIYPDDNTSYDYNLPVVKKTTIHQHRVTPGRGMRSRYYSVGLRGKKNATLELDSMQVNFTKTTRRLG